MNWQLKAYMKMPWKYDGKHRLLNSFADYCLWYGTSANIETNLVIVEATANELASSGETQLLTYMSMVHLARVQMEKVNRVVRQRQVQFLQDWTKWHGKENWHLNCPINCDFHKSNFTSTRPVHSTGAIPVSSSRRYKKGLFPRVSCFFL